MPTVNRIIFITFVIKKRSFDLLQNEVKYRISLVSKSLPIKLRNFQVPEF